MTAVAPNFPISGHDGAMDVDRMSEANWNSNASDRYRLNIRRAGVKLSVWRCRCAMTNATEACTNPTATQNAPVASVAHRKARTIETRDSSARIKG